VATDAHKWPNVGYDSGLAIVKDGAALLRRWALLPPTGPGSRREPYASHSRGVEARAGVELWRR